MNGNKNSTAATRQNILNAATRVITRKGFDAARLSEIAGEAGVTEPTIYLNFKGKESLLFSIAEDYMKRYFVFLEEQLQGINGAHNKLRKLVWAHLRYSDMNRDFMSVVLFDCRNNRNFYQSGAYKLFRQYARNLTAILDEGVREEIFRTGINIILVRDIIFGLMDYEAIRYFVIKEEPDAVSSHEDIMKILDQMLLRRNRTENLLTDKRERILQAAVQSFSEKGYSEVTIAEIAGRADVASGTIYEYFQNKEDLLLSISEEHFGKSLTGLKNTFGSNDIQSRLLVFMQYFFQQYLDNPNFIVVFLTMIQFNRRFYKSRAYRSQNKYVSELESMVQEMLDESNAQVVNIRIFRNMILGAFTHMALRWFLVRRDRTYDKMDEIREVARLLSDVVSKVSVDR